ncbi:hypothetical protein ColTof4_01483 [Colletotrichum tofieldiae]|nr:hypothetical protein ColTof3_08741 [Colletotrichum tofieldiae]GKT69060.1 hypothetical protein ColTof4_01483 [Colletotrichum tofieldiae]
MPSSMSWALALMLYAVAALAFQSEREQIPLALSNERKNVVIILTDDQDATMDSVAYMPRLKEHIIDQGVSFANHFTTTAICCPSRVSLWTGRQPHNTNVTDVDPPYGGFPKFIAQGLNDAYLPVWLQDAGYATYYAGKMFNSHTVNNYNAPFMAGWTANNFLLDPGTYSYLNPIYQRNHDEPIHHKGRHTTELIQEHAAQLLDDAMDSGNPFFVALAPIAPHSNIDANDGGPPVMTEPVPLRRHADLFHDVTVPRTQSFNPDRPSGASWIAGLPRLNATSVAALDAFYRQRLRALQGVDELVEQVIRRLEAAGRLDDTYVIFTSDNGYHLGQHRLPPGKECGYDEDIRVPFFVRGPGVAKGARVDAVTAHIDVAPTLFRVAGIELRSNFDGAPMPLPREVGQEEADNKDDDKNIREHVAVEYWGTAIAEGRVGGFDGNGQIVMANNTYKAIRLKSQRRNLYYAVWCTNEHELYDLQTDPHQMNNLYPAVRPAAAWLERLVERLDSLMMVMKSCKGVTCRQPWDVLHPPKTVKDGDRVRSLDDALHPRFDAFYAAQARVSFSRCEPGYIPSSEGPQVGYQYKGSLGWSRWA